MAVYFVARRSRSFGYAPSSRLVYRQNDLAKTVNYLAPEALGLIGGMSWESSAVYYELINEKVKRELGGLHSCHCLMYSVDFAEVETLQHQGQWTRLDEMMAGAARRLELAGADLLVLCTNTMHQCAEAIQQAVHIPFLHIADATAQAIKARGLRTVGLLGTRFTMERDFYRGRLEREHGLAVLIPEEAGREEVHRIIYDELVLGEIRPESRRIYQRIITGLAEQGAQGVILGCTEIPLLIKAEDVSIPVFDTTTLHAEWAVEQLLEMEE